MAELPLAGDAFAGFRLRSVIGRGPMSVVYAAEHPRLGDALALKVLAAEPSADEVFRSRFLAESRIAATMSHPHVIGPDDTGLSDGLLFSAMRRVADGNLRQVSAARGPLLTGTVVALLSQAAQALDAAHLLGLVHRDVKPENLLIEWDEQAGSGHLYLSDFGISRLGMERNGLTATGRLLGSTDYVAPEQLSEPTVYGSADQYSLGCVLYEALTGRLPFPRDSGARGADPRATPPPTGLSPAVDEMFARVLAQRPGDRYNTCREFQQAASAVLADRAAVPLPGDASRTSSPTGARAAAARTKAATKATAAGRKRSTATQPVAAQAESGREEPPRAGFLRSGSGRPRARWLVLAAVLLLACVGGGVGAYAARSAPAAAAKAVGPVPTAVASPSPTSRPGRTGKLVRVLTAADKSKLAMGLLPPSSCAPQGPATLACTAPSTAIARATFTLYPTRVALFAAYEAKVRSLRSGRYRQNVKNCGRSAPSPYGEIAWNHREQHSRAYTVAQMATGAVPVGTAMGRVACMRTAGQSEDIVWTTDYGKMLGVAIGAGPHTGVWEWWVAVHHNIVFPGTPMDMGGDAAPLMSGAPTPTRRASGASSASTGRSGKATAPAS